MYRRVTCWINFLFFSLQVKLIIISVSTACVQRGDNELLKHDKWLRCFSSSFQRACDLIWLGYRWCSMRWATRWSSHIHALNICTHTHTHRTRWEKKKNFVSLSRQMDWAHLVSLSWVEPLSAHFNGNWQTWFTLTRCRWLTRTRSNTVVMMNVLSYWSPWNASSSSSSCCFDTQWGKHICSRDAHSSKFCLRSTHAFYYIACIS